MKHAITFLVIALTASLSCAAQGPRGRDERRSDAPAHTQHCPSCRCESAAGPRRDGPGPDARGPQRGDMGPRDDQRGGPELRGAPHRPEFTPEFRPGSRPPFHPRLPQPGGPRAEAGRGSGEARPPFPPRGERGPLGPRPGMRRAPLGPPHGRPMPPQEGRVLPPLRREGQEGPRPRQAEQGAPEASPRAPEAAPEGPMQRVPAGPARPQRNRMRRNDAAPTTPRPSPESV
jgi:hypothetical protein